MCGVYLLGDAVGLLPDKSTGQGCYGQDIRANDLYPTPAPLTRALLAVEELPHLLWEPAAGLGHMSRELSRAGHNVIATDLVDYGHGIQGGVDFLKLQRAACDATCIVTNPPFELSNDFVRHGLRLCEKVCILNRLMFLEGVGRSDIIDRHLVRVYPFRERPPFMHRWSRGEDGVWREWEGKKASSAMPFAWFIFERSPTVSGTTLQRLSWRDFDNEARIGLTTAGAALL